MFCLVLNFLPFLKFAFFCFYCSLSFSEGSIQFYACMYGMQSASLLQPCWGPAPSVMVMAIRERNSSSLSNPLPPLVFLFFTPEFSCLVSLLDITTPVLLRERRYPFPSLNKDKIRSKEERVACPFVIFCGGYNKESVASEACRFSLANGIENSPPAPPPAPIVGAHQRHPREGGVAPSRNKNSFPSEEQDGDI